MSRIILLPMLCAFMLTLASCGDSIEATKVQGHPKKAFEANPTDAVGVAEGDKKVSPFGKPAH